MAWFDVILFLTSLQTILAGQKQHLVQSSNHRTYFTAAVFEHAKLGNSTTDSPSEIVAMNLNFYRRAAETAKAKGADIIAFPEYGIYVFSDKREKIKVYLEIIPDHNTARWNPCEHSEQFATRPILRNLSCMAKENQIVIVSGVGEIQPCTKEQSKKCPDDGSFHFNTNVAFDRDGTLIGVYRKEHLFFEVSMDLPIEPQNATFHTDFGTFAMYICFETIFEKMALSGRSVDAVILSTMWIDSRPLMSSVQQWMSWTVGNGASLLVSNVQIPGYGAAGSGIFNGKLGALKYTYNTDGLSKLIVSNVPKRGFEHYPFENSNASITVITANDIRPYEVDVDNEEGKNIPDVCDWKVLGDAKDIYKDFRCMHEKTANYTFHKLVTSNGDIEACHNGLCCSLKYSAESINETFYLVVFNGTHNSLDRYFWCEEACLVVRCDAFNGSECNTFPSSSNTVFKSLEIKGTFSTDFTYPAVVGTGLRLASLNEEWNFNAVKTVDGYYPATLSYTDVKNRPLLVASINARCYDRDPPYVR